MAINFKAGDIVNTVPSFITGTLAINPTKTTATTITILAMLGSLDFRLTNVGNVSGLFFVRGVPENNDGTPAITNGLYHLGKGASIYFETEAHLNGAFGSGAAVSLNTVDGAVRLGTRALQTADRALQLSVKNRPVSIALPDLTANGVKTVGLWASPYWAKLQAISIGYDTVPASAAGTILLSLNKKSGGVTTSLLQSANFDLETLADGVSSNILLNSANTDLARNDYVSLFITSNNADAQVGVGGVVSFSLDINPAK